LTALDTSFLYMEGPTTPMHVGSVMVFQPPDQGFDYEHLVSQICRRIAVVPRYRQCVREVPGHLANPVWVDDETFDVMYHVRRSALPQPGSDEQLQEFVARIQSRRLDRGRPLWEVYLVEGLAEGRFAIVTKSHQALVDGINAVDIADLIVDGKTGGEESITDTWSPAREPSDVELVAAALVDAVRRPSQIAENVRGALTDVKVGGPVFSTVGAVVSTVARTAVRPAPVSPLNAEIGEARRYVMVGTDLADYRAVRSRLARGHDADEVTINDVVLATISGALRSWLLTRGEAVHAATTVRAMVPVSVDDTDGSGRLGNRVIAAMVDLPVGEPGACMRLHQIAFAMRQQIDGGRAAGAESLAGLAGFGSPTLHFLGARLGSAMSRRVFNVIITNVPGPQELRCVGDARMLSTYPVMPLALGQAASIGLTSYDGGVYFGLNGDRDAMPDLDLLGQCLVDSLADLVGIRGSRR
jgi:diacylglycerol O-acyltransferase